MSVKFSPLGTQVARLIIAGDVTAARALAATRILPGWTVAEGRGIIGACEEANRRYGCAIDWREFS